MSVERYLGLVEAGALSEDDRVELLEGVVVAMTPSNPQHAAVVTMATRALLRAVGERASVRVHTGPRPVLRPGARRRRSPGSDRDHLTAHPKTALLVAEVSDTSLQQDRLTKAAIYAAAGIPEYWIVNLRDCVLEVMREPDRAQARYRDVRTLGGRERIELSALPGSLVAVSELLPS